VAADRVSGGSRPPRVTPGVPSVSSAPHHAGLHVPRGDSTVPMEPGVGGLWVGGFCGGGVR
jgi:hypothetical protein